jgi:L-fucose mutarotase/ribose pyranase (RbsD/FucU family)
LAKRAAAHVPLDSPGAVAFLLDRLREAGAGEEVAALLARNPAAHVTLDNPDAVAFLLASLREAGAGEEVAALAARLPAAGHFAQFIKTSDHVDRFRFGREPDGSAAPSWVWDDLE